MKTDKKALLFVILLSVVTIGLAIALIAFGWNYISENVLDDDFVDSVKEWFADDDDDDDDDRYADEDDDEDEEDDKSVDKDLPTERENTKAPEERVYDYADVLTDDEEDKLREYIALYEDECAMDIVIVILDEDIEEEMDADWEDAMQEYAENFYDDNKYGYDEPYGDGVLLLDNWYDGQAGSWITTSGRLADEYSEEDLNEIFDVMFSVIEEDPCGAYMIFVNMIANN